MNSFLRVLLVLYLVIPPPSPPAQPQAAQPRLPSSAVIITAAEDQYPLGRHVALFEDSSNTFTIDQIAAAGGPQFTPSREAVPNLGYTRSTIWARVELENDSPVECATCRDWLLEVADPTLDEVTLYLATQGSRTFQTKRLGDMTSRAEFEVDHRNLVFKLRLEPQTTYQLYLQVRNRGSTPLPLTLWSPAALLARDYHAQFGFGLYYGFIVIMVAYNLFLFLFLREAAYFDYVLAVTSLGLYQLALDGLAAQYLWPTLMWWSNVAILVCIGLTVLNGARFAEHFLKLEDYAPRWIYPTTGLKLFAAGLVIFGLVPDYYATVAPLLAVATVSAGVLGIALGLVTWRKGYRPARYYLLAWAGVLVSASIVVFSQFDLLPVSFLTEYGLRVGVVAMILLLSVALADRINLLQLDMERVNDELQESDRQLRAYQGHLEGLVAEQTAELRQRLADNARLYEEAQRATIAAEAASRAKSEFLTNVSHELRTPLNGVLGYTQLLKRDPALNPDHYKAIETIQYSGEHLLTLLDDILDLARIEVGRMELRRQEFHLNYFLNGIVDMIRVRAEQKGLRFVFEIGPDLPGTVLGDEIRLRQVLVNLLGNAVKFTETGQVRFSIDYHQDKIRFQVEDTGIGIASERLAEIFVPFHQINPHIGKVEGTGLGLTISQRLATMMGGSLAVESRLGVGSIFWLDLPLPAGQPRIGPIPAVEKKAIIGYEGPKRTVLVVDDVPRNRAILTDMLNAIGFDVIETADGAEAVAQAAQAAPDIILMDLAMPVLDGFEATRQIRRLQLAKTPVILAVSARAFDDDRHESLQAGCDDFVAKPYRFDDLLQKMGHYTRLTWRYDQAASQPADQPPDEPLPWPDKLSLEVLTTLLELVKYGDIKGIRHYLAGLEAHNQPLISRLDQLAERYQLRHMQRLLESYLTLKQKEEES